MREHGLSPSSEDYLKVIWTAQEWTDKPVTTNELSARLGFAASTVSEAIKRLTEQGLVTHPPYGPIRLTTAGTSAALRMVRRHRLIESFLVGYLDYGWDEVHDDAEVLEHAVTDRFIEKLADKLGNPSRDPHGDPIPDREGRIQHPPAVTLNDAPLGKELTVVRVSDTYPDILRYLRARGIGPDSPLQITSRNSAAGAISVTALGELLELTLTAAAAVWVTVTD